MLGFDHKIHAQTTAVEFATKAYEQIQRKDYSSALENFNTALSLDKNLTNVFANRAEILFLMKRYRDVILDTTEFIKRNPGESFVFNLRGMAYYNLGEYEKARSDYSESIRINPRFAQSFNNRGILSLKEGLYDKAILDFTKAVEIDPLLAIAFSNRGFANIEKNNLSDAQVDVEHALKIDANLAYALNNRGLIYLKRGDYAEAIKSFKDVISRDSSLVLAHSNLADTFSEMKDYKNAIAKYSDSIKLDGGNALLFRKRGSAKASLGDVQGAIDDFTESIRINPKEPAYYAFRAVEFKKLEKFHEATQDYTSAISIAPKWYPAYAGRAGLWEERRMFDKAIDDYSSVIRIEPNDPRAYRSRGMIQVQIGKHREALLDLEKALVLDPDNKFWNGLITAFKGLAWLALNDTAKAIEFGNKALEIDPQQKNAHSLIVKAYYNLQRYDLALQSAQAWVKYDLTDWQAANMRGLLYLHLGMLDLALNDFNEAFSRNSKGENLDVLYNNRGVVFNKKGDYERAIDDLNRAIESNPNYPNPYNHRGNVWSRLGKSTNALKDFDKAIELNNKYALAFYNRGVELERLGNESASIDDYKKAISLDPSNKDAAASLVLALEKKDQRLKRTEQSDKSNKSASKGVDKHIRVALVIGNGKYRNAAILPNAERDAELVAASLKQVGFDRVKLTLNASRSRMIELLRSFSEEARNADQALVFFSGHGIEVGGINYLAPIDVVDLVENNVSSTMVNMGYLLNSIESAQKLRILIIDACRDNPFGIKSVPVVGSRRIDVSKEAARISMGRGLARVEPEPGTLVVYATKHGQVAFDGEGSNSPFTESLVQRMLQRPPIEIRRLFDFVREDVFEKTKRAQQPFAYGSLPARDDFFFSR